MKYHHGGKQRVISWLRNGLPLTEIESILRLRVSNPAVFIRREGHLKGVVKSRKVLLSEVQKRLGINVKPAILFDPVKQMQEFVEGGKDFEVTEWYIPLNKQHHN